MMMVRAIVMTTTASLVVMMLRVTLTMTMTDDLVLLATSVLTMNVRADAYTHVTA